VCWSCISQVREAQDLTQGICDFLEARGGSAPTPDLISHFGATVSAARMALFRQLLKQVQHQTLHGGYQEGSTFWSIQLAPSTSSAIDAGMLNRQ
jgi:hypothetical protein